MKTVQNMKGKKSVHAIGLQETYIINRATVNQQKVLLLDTHNIGDLQAQLPRHRSRLFFIHREDKSLALYALSPLQLNVHGRVQCPTSSLAT